MNLETQWITLLWMLASGGILGVVFDSYRVISGQLHFPRWSIHVLDLLYWVAAALFVFRVLYHSNQGELRFYVFLGLLIGIWIYFLFLSVITERFVLMLMRISNKIYRMLVRTIEILLIAPLKWLVNLIWLMLGFLWTGIVFLLRITFLPVWKLIRWAFGPIWRKLRVPEGWTKVQHWAAMWRDRSLRLLRWFNKE